ncbi:RNA-binding protein [Brevundimonas naejangsanensis]|uniref:RNA-binding protein n=1 Tax=Brevundimonas naejangsanensis TaxID=588932 RepID=A0A494RJ39_9CAUL|nr:ribonuclease E/G [Brevundimonas naejangsanensis]AYG95429.1 RNA-binding protein [Brevundimonas naejangsanensis]
MADVEVFLDAAPGETRGMVFRDGRACALIIHRDDDRPEHRLGARLVGRVAKLAPGLHGAFVDLGCGEPFGFLPLGKADRPGEGAKLEVEVTAEPRERKGPVLRRLGEASGEPRLLAPGPGVAAILKHLAPGVAVVTGAEAIRAALEAEEEALSGGVVEPAVGLDLAIQRTRALIAVDIDYAPAAGRDSRKGREAVNREGLRQAARLLALKGWGGLVAVDLVGVGLHPDAVLQAARQAFAAHEGAAVGPLSRFGLLQLSLPWGRTPADERLAAPSARELGALRRLRLALLTDRAAPRLTLHCDSGAAAVLAPWVADLGPRAHIRPDAAPGVFEIKEG